MLTELGLPSADGLRDSLYRAFTDRANYTLFDDVRPVLEELTSEGYALGLVSNFEAWLDELLADLGVREAFGVRVISGIEGMEKPDPRIYRLALERADVDAADAVYVGDNPEFDIDPPAALGMFPVLIDRRERHAGPRRRAHHGPGGPGRGAPWLRTSAGSRARRRTPSSPSSGSGCRACSTRAAP